MENWPTLAAILALQTAITIPMAGVMWQQVAKLSAEKDARLADRDATIVKQDKEIADLKAKVDDMMDMAFDAVRGTNSAVGMARETTQIVREERARRGTR